MIPYVKSNDGVNDSIVLFIGGLPHTVDSSHVSFDEICERIDELTANEARKLIDVKAAVARKLARLGNVVVEGDTVTYKGEVVHGQLSYRMVEMLEEGRDIRAWALFMENLQQNPAKHAVDELYLWLERSGMPITERGNFLAYKKVKDDYTSYHTNADGTPFRNDIGTLCSMQRNKVDDNRNKTCSAGLHFCSWDYLPHYMGNRGKVVLVEVNPAHVVSIPSDYDNAKGRAEAYMVVGEIPESECEHAFQTSFASYASSDYITWDYDDPADYSDVEDDGWDYDTYDDEDDWDGTKWERDQDYDEGYDEGKRDALAFKVSNAEAAWQHCSLCEYYDEFMNGYNDGYMDNYSAPDQNPWELIDLDEEESLFEDWDDYETEEDDWDYETDTWELCDQWETVEAPVEQTIREIFDSVKLPNDTARLAYNRGYDQGTRDVQFNRFVACVNDGTDFVEDYMEGYVLGFYG